ncbi:hypothetical protein FNF31_02404 [Cafeteria roenbergensis]|uniref:Uncharacterized protein n=1 Tax=Cafeteria roenbergensis TaxID=33653 RepID=A0A5A8DZA1_CAFRO|nr:hypothetical protein FNF31_02404 [Cafeteria roenbergensis]KAA0170044.1 hypothetical protein FNF28_01653 [Cafeteria roenbergensis]
MASDDKMIARVFWPTGDELGGAGAPLCGRGWLVGCNLGGLDLCVLAVVPAEVASPGFILDRIAAFWEWHDRAKDGYATAFGGVRPTIVGAWVGPTRGQIPGRSGSAGSASASPRRPRHRRKPSSSSARASVGDSASLDDSLLSLEDEEDEDNDEGDDDEDDEDDEDDDEHAGGRGAGPDPWQSR